MPAVIKVQLSIEALAEAITSLDLQEKRRLKELIEQEISRAEAFEQNALATIRAEDAANEYLRLDEYAVDAAKPPV
jgi:uncharacterized protein YjbK